jgi:hypothetical protein
MSNYVESIVRTNKLYCSDCGAKIKKGQSVVFKLKYGRMQDVYCVKCKEGYLQETRENELHPFSSEALGQE